MEMSWLNLHRRLAAIEARCRRPPISVEQLASLLIDATPEVIQETFSHPLLPSSRPNQPAEGETTAQPIRCSRCGQAGPFSEMRRVAVADYLTKKKKKDSEPVSVHQLRDGLDRATLAVLMDAISVAHAELDPELELLRLDCLVCGQPKLYLKEQPGLGSSDNPI